MNRLRMALSRLGLIVFDTLLEPQYSCHCIKRNGNRAVGLVIVVSFHVCFFNHSSCFSAYHLAEMFTSSICQVYHQNVPQYDHKPTSAVTHITILAIILTISIVITTSLMIYCILPPPPPSSL